MTLRLLTMASEYWQDIDGYSVGHGFDPAELRISRLCNFTWWWFTRNAERKEVEKFKARLWRPPPGHRVDHTASPWHADNENKAFAQLKQALGGKVNSA